MNTHKLKLAFLVWISIYPLVTAVFYFFGPLLLQMPLMLRTLALTLFVVPVMVFILIPFWTKTMKKLFKNW